MMADADRALARHLATLKKLRAADIPQPARLAEVKRWQSQRLAATYADVAALPRYRAATRFFLDDLYGPKDFSGRDQEMMRILPTMARILPASAVETAALAIELEALSEDLDQRLARALADRPLDEGAYAEAYRASGKRSERERQVHLIGEVGRRLDALVKKPFVFRTLKLMRAPARMAGLQDLQDFLERGFESFRAMQGAGEFLDLVRERETAILSRILSGAERPFSA
jgi:hypothetical protein